MSERANIHEFPSRREPNLATYGGGPHDPTMEARVARLEEDFRSMRADISATRSDTSYIRGRLESLPSTWQMIATVIGGNVALAALLFAAMKYLGHS